VSVGVSTLVTAWGQTLSKMETVMLLSLTQALVPTAAAAGDAGFPVPSVGGQGKPTGRAAAAAAVDAGGHRRQPGTDPVLPPDASSQHPAKFASSMEILILPGRGEAAIAGGVQSSDPRGSNPC